MNCTIIQDLLPLYIDDFCSKESRALVEEHLAECEVCSEKHAAQKGELKVNESIIKENLKAKRPFKKIIISFITIMVLIAIMVPLLILSYCTIEGDGIGFATIDGRIKSQRFLSLLEKGQFERAAGYVRFWGTRIGVDLTKEEERIRWIEGMEQLKEDGIEFVSHKEIKIETDDGFTYGYAIVSVKYGNGLYDFALGLYTRSGKVEPGGIGYLHDFEFERASEEEKMIIERVNEIIPTYDPG